MNISLGRWPSAWAFPAAICGLLAAGCDSSPSPFRPPTAAVNAAPQPAELPAQAVEEESDSPTVSDPAGDTERQAERVPEANATELTVPEAKSPQAEPPAKTDFDPIQVNGKYFEGWPKPKMVLVISGRQDGYLEPCGCAGLENQKGGLSRRHAFLRQLSERGWPVTAVDVGGLVRRFGKQAEIQFAITADALKQMGYGAVGFGPADLRLSAGDTAVAVAGAEPKDCIFVSANVNLFDLTPKMRIVEAGGMKLGITSVLGKTFAQQVNNAEIEIKPAAEALKQVMPLLKGCDVRILLAQATIDECKALAKQFPQFDLVVAGESLGDPPAQPETIPGSKSRLIEVGPKGEYVIVAGFYGPKQPIRFQRVALDSRFPNTDEMKQSMVTYQDQLQQLGWEGLGLHRVASPRAQDGDKLAGQFVGAATCKDCHSAEWEVWSKSKHAHATETLAKLNPPRQFDPECISCHATGWNSQEHFPYLSGFDSLDKTPLLVSNSCENCHGPGAAHVAAEKAGPDTAKAIAARESLKIRWPQAQSDVCIKCHDGDNSPEFSKNVDKYWSEIAH